MKAKRKQWRRRKAVMLSKRRARSPGRYDAKRANRAVDFIQHLPHVKGKWAGQKIRLMSWQRAIVEDVFGTLNRDGSRQYRLVYIEIPKKNGKTTLAAAILNYCLFADKEPGAEVYCAAYDRDQACIVWDVAAEQIRRTPQLARRARILDYRKTIKKKDDGAALCRAVEREAAGQHGYNVSGLIFDEFHTQRSPELWDTLKEGTALRTQPLIFIITTSGYDRESVCWKLHDYARKILEGKHEDPTFYPVIYSAAEGDGVESDIDWLDEELWYKANPALGSFLPIDQMRAAASRAQEIPEEQNEFKRLRLDIWTQAESRLIDGDKWDKCGKGLKEKELEGAIAFGGLDLSTTTDVAAFAMTIPVDGHIETVYRFWCPADTIRRRSKDDGVPYQAWVDQGYMTATPGSVIDFDTIKEEVVALSERFQLQRVHRDRWNSEQMGQDLEKRDVETAPMGQGFASMSEPTKELVRLVYSIKLRHDGHPVMRWMIDNLVAEKDAAGNLKPSKKKSTEKIDGCVALIMAIDAMIRTEEEQPSIYESRGPIVIEV